MTPRITPIDWRELYAANRAVIEGRTGTPHGTLQGPPLGTLPGMPLGTLQSPSPAGTWEEHTCAGGRFFVHAPEDIDSEPVPLLVMLHGCTQSAASFAAGTLMNDVADRHGFVVVYPEQSRDRNPMGCWSWFDAAHRRRDTGEPAFIAEAAQTVMEATSDWNIDAERVFVAGMSAGGAMASVMAMAYPDLFAGVAVHSGLACGSAGDQGSAFAAMSKGGPDPKRLAAAAFSRVDGLARPVPAVVIHGDADRTVSPVNGDQVVEQWLTFNRLAAPDEFDGELRQPTTTSRDDADGRACTRRRWTDRDGAVLQESVKVEGLGHAWSGGAPGGSYTDPSGPVASELIWDFFTVCRAAPRVAC
ncbi:MAG: esterase, depolymerase family [Solirubrobacterales bacterium]|nr:esterase, depolymerase family [Solirubrobacterales bacterium]